TKPVHRRVQAALVIDERTVCPQTADEVLPVDDLSGMLEQRQKHLQGLFLKPDPQPAPAKFALVGIDLENSEPHQTVRHSGGPTTGLPESLSRSCKRSGRVCAYSSASRSA